MKRKENEDERERERKRKSSKEVRKSDEDRTCNLYEVRHEGSRTTFCSRARRGRKCEFILSSRSEKEAGNLNEEEKCD